MHRDTGTERRAEAARAAIGNARLAGVTLTAGSVALLDAFVAGRIDAEAMVERALDIAAACAGAAEIARGEWVDMDDLLGDLDRIIDEAEARRAHRG